MPGCFARAGDCDRAWTLFKDMFIPERLPDMKDKAQAEQIARQSFESFPGTKKCKTQTAAK